MTGEGKEDINLTGPEPTAVTDGERSDDDLQEDEEQEDVREVYLRETQWDEGGPSHCGYSDSVHDTIMSVGKAVHGVVGEPSEEVEDGPMHHVGNWFQEASYAVRDIVRGNHKEVANDVGATMSTVKHDLMETGSVVSGALGGGGSVTGKKTSETNEE
mmetsp:Transcript_62971/g.185986  ORF Transcript_62971/g.185986 Transcript_62971/m.185986 type:complete len:158 (-) Transcript_62971:255-728(-)